MLWSKSEPDNYSRGGIRGIVELEILRQIEKAMGGMLAIQYFFELIVGTRSGLLVHCFSMDADV